MQMRLKLNKFYAKLYLYDYNTDNVISSMTNLKLGPACKSKKYVFSLKVFSYTGRGKMENETE